MLEQYLRMFASLRADKGRDRYPEITARRCRNQVRSTKSEIRNNFESPKFE